MIRLFILQAFLIGVVVRKARGTCPTEAPNDPLLESGIHPSYGTNRRDEVVLCRYRIGHTHLIRTYLLKGEPRPECIPCHYPLTDDTFLSSVSTFDANSMKKLCDDVPPENILDCFSKCVNRICTADTLTKNSVLVDMSTFLDTEASCSCTFSTSAKRIKVMTLRAPNYIGCGSAVDIKVGSNGLQIACLMSGTFVDMRRYREGTLIFSTEQMFYDSNYCLILEADGGSSENITVTCIDPYPPTVHTLTDENIETTSLSRVITAATRTILFATTRITTPVTSTTTAATSTTSEAATNTTSLRVTLASKAAKTANTTTQPMTSPSLYTNDPEGNTTEREKIYFHTVETTTVTSMGTSTEAILMGAAFSASTAEVDSMNASVSNIEQTTSVLDYVTSSDNETQFFPGTSTLLRDQSAKNSATDLVMNVTVQADSPELSSTTVPEYLTSEIYASTFDRNITMGIQYDNTTPSVAHNVKATSRTPSKGTTSTKYTAAGTQPVPSTNENPVIANLTMNITRFQEIYPSISKISLQETTTRSMPSNGSKFTSQSSEKGASTIDNTNETSTMILKTTNITEMLQSLTSGEMTTLQISTVTDSATVSTTKRKDPSPDLSFSTTHGVKSVPSWTAEENLSTQAHSVDIISSTTTRTNTSSLITSPKTASTGDSTTDQTETNTKTVITAKQTETTVAVETIVPVETAEAVQSGTTVVTASTKQHTKVTQKQTASGPKLQEKSTLSTTESIKIRPTTQDKVNVTLSLSKLMDSETFADRAVNILKYNKLVFIIVAVVVAIVLAVITGLVISYKRMRSRKVTITGWSTVASYKNMSFDDRSVSESVEQGLKSQTDNVATTKSMQPASKFSTLPETNHC